MRVEVNGYFRSLPLTGTGQHLIHLMAALREGYPGVTFVERNVPGRLRGRPAKIWWEQVAWPTRAYRSSTIRHVPYLAPPIIDPNSVVTAHDAIHFVLPEYKARAAQQLYGALVQMGIRRTRQIIAVSQWTRRDLMNVLRVPAARIHVVHNGIAPSLSPSPEKDDFTALERYPLPDRYALYLGGFDVRKNLGVVLDAWPGVWKATRTPLVVAGRRPVRRNPVHVDWFSAYQGAPWLKLIGAVDEADKAAIYRAATVFVFPSRYEGFGLDPLEAMACGVPVIAAEATSLPEILGDAALFVGTDDVAGWERVISEVLSDPARAASFRDAGLKRARMFSWQHAAEATMAVYDGMST